MQAGQGAACRQAAPGSCGQGRDVVVETCGAGTPALPAFGANTSANPCASCCRGGCRACRLPHGACPCPRLLPGRLRVQGLSRPRWALHWEAGGPGPGGGERQDRVAATHRPSWALGINGPYKSSGPPQAPRPVGRGRDRPQEFCFLRILLVGTCQAAPPGGLFLEPLSQRARLCGGCPTSTRVVWVRCAPAWRLHECHCRRDQRRGPLQLDGAARSMWLCLHLASSVWPGPHPESPPCHSEEVLVTVPVLHALCSPSRRRAVVTAALPTAPAPSAPTLGITVQLFYS